MGDYLLTPKFRVFNTMNVTKTETKTFCVFFFFFFIFLADHLGSVCGRDDGG
jgi:hypothetical protein